MKIRAIHTREAGPLGSQVFDFKDDWGGDIASSILFSGPNGCGKSSVLRAAAMLWNAFGHWLHHRKALPRSNPEREWLQRWGGVTLVLEELPFGGPPTLLLFGVQEFAEQLQQIYPDHAFVGEWMARTGKPGAPARKLLWPSDAPWLDQWTEARQKMLVSADKGESPNMIFLDAEERRWVSPKRGVGEIRPENPQQRWLTSYRVSEQWDGQLEAALLAMKSAALHRFHELIRDMNAFLSGKEILTEVKLGENRLKVRLKNGSGTTHGLDELSAGEHQVLIQLYLINRWLEKGGVALIDEPDLYLHPSLVSSFLARLEKMVADRGGQLIITSHVPEVWSRYEALGRRILLEATR
ncbi:MAG: ATP-binding protein [Chromatiaceae bacterium]|nr:ATP-binding protein [Chromatiaceae bacterium]